MLEYKKIRETDKDLPHTQVLFKGHILGYFIKNTSNAAAQFEHWNFVSKSHLPSFYTKTRKEVLSNLEHIMEGTPIKLTQSFGIIHYENVEVFVEAMYKHLNSFWYYGDIIAKINYNGKIYQLESRGEQRVYFEDNVVLTNQQAVQYAFDDNIKDDVLPKLNWDMNNWLVVIEVDNKGNCISDDLAIAHDYHEGMEYLLTVVLES